MMLGGDSIIDYRKKLDATLDRVEKVANSRESKEFELEIYVLDNKDAMCFSIEFDFIQLEKNIVYSVFVDSYDKAKFFQIDEEDFITSVLKKIYTCLMKAKEYKQLQEHIQQQEQENKDNDQTN